MKLEQIQKITKNKQTNKPIHIKINQTNTRSTTKRKILMRKNVSFNLEQCYNNHYQLIFLLLFFVSGDLLISTVTSSSTPSPAVVSASTESARTQPVPSPQPSLSSSPSRKIHKLVCTLSALILVLVIVIVIILVVNTCNCHFLWIRQMNMSLNLTEWRSPETIP